MALRVLSHLLLARIPDEGMEEVAESLGHMYLFYARQPKAKALAAPPPELKATYGTALQRQPFRVPDED